MRTAIFVIVFITLVLQRLLELRRANRNTTRLLTQGAMEYGAEHYPLIVALHTAFFISLVAEFIVSPNVRFDTGFLLIAIVAQLGRWWVLHTLGERWTTRVIVLPNAERVRSGPYKYFHHPNYVVVAIELAVIPLIFGLIWTALVFTVANAVLLLLIRIPVERKALENEI